MKPLWTKKELIEATGAIDPTNKFLDKKNADILGVRINEKTIKKHDLFIALKGDRVDGHNFIESALQKGAIGSIASDYEIAKKYNALYVVDTKVALIKMAEYSRKRFKGKTIGITGSSGKTSTKFITMAALQNYGATHSTEGNNNNLLGLSLTLARLPSTSKYCVLELGMNSGGEIEKLAKIASPNIALITNVSNSHIANFKSEKDIAAAKSEIFLGLKDPGITILNADGKWCAYLSSKAKKANSKIYYFGSKSTCKTKVLKIQKEINGTTVSFNDTKNWFLDNLNSTQAINAISVLALLDVLKLDISQGMKTISKLKPLPGRGEKVIINFKENNNSIIIDDSYNANPSSMNIALISYYKSKFNFPNYNSILIIGDMLELGNYSDKMHQKLVPIINKIDPSLIITVGNEIKKITRNLKNKIKCRTYLNVEKLLIDLPKIIQPNQYILIKGSNGTGLWKIINLLKNTNKMKDEYNVA